MYSAKQGRWLRAGVTDVVSSFRLQRDANFFTSINRAARSILGCRYRRKIVRHRSAGIDVQPDQRCSMQTHQHFTQLHWA